MDIRRYLLRRTDPDRTRKPLARERLAVLIVLGMELSIQPSNNRDWPPESARTAFADVAGDAITIHNVRNFDYRKDAPPVENWETRTVHLSNLRGADFFLNYWSSSWIAHPILSFDFGPEGHIAFSIETWPDKHESYSTLGGLYRRFELIYVVTDERDVIRVRTNYRDNGHGEDVYLFSSSKPIQIDCQRGFWSTSNRSTSSIKRRGFTTSFPTIALRAFWRR